MKVSVVMAVHNDAWCLCRALDSVLAQTRPAYEILVCDAGSVDGTPDLIEDRYGEAVRLLRLPEGCVSATRAAGLDQTRGDWLAWVDADDTWRPNKLERQMEFIAHHPEVRWVSSDGTYEGADGPIRDSWLSDFFDPVEDRVGDLLPSLIDRCWVLAGSVMVERRAYVEVGGLDREMVHTHDWDLWLRLLARYPGGLISQRLVSCYASPREPSADDPARRRDHVDLMHRVERGALGQRRAVQRRAGDHAASLAYDLGLQYLSAGQPDQARPYLKMAAGRGPASRRVMAATAALLPAWALGALRRTPRPADAQPARDTAPDAKEVRPRPPR